jgi:3-hydroxy-3-methylglutaryl CoA synthase
VANFDEDSITMAVAAARDCLNGKKREDIDGLLFASTTSPYKEKQSATIVAAAADLRHDITTGDLANSLKAGTTALKAALDMVKAGSAKQVIVAAADCRLGEPLSEFEANLGDGAAAILVGDTDVVAEFLGSYSVVDETMTFWRADGDAFIRSPTDERFHGVEGYRKVVGDTLMGLAQKMNLSPKDITKLALYTHSPRRAVEVAGSLGLDPRTQLQDNLFDAIGNTGVPYSLILLVAALEQAKPGDLILVASYGDGSDALAFRVTDEIEKIKGNHRGVKKHLEPKIMIDYKTYLVWRGILVKDLQPYPITIGNISHYAQWRERNQNLRLHGSKCKNCGTIQYPPQRVCAKCQASDQSEEVSLSDKRGKVFTYSMDPNSSPVDKPIVVPIIDFEGGGRMLCYMTDRVAEEVKVGMEVEMTFRKIAFREGTHNYFWKATPIRA